MRYRYFVSLFYRAMYYSHSGSAIHLLPEEHGEILKRLQVGWGKVVRWSTKAVISLKRVREKLSWRAKNVLSDDTTPDHAPMPPFR